MTTWRWESARGGGHGSIVIDLTKPPTRWLEMHRDTIIYGAWLPSPAWNIAEPTRVDNLRGGPLPVCKNIHRDTNNQQ